MCSWSTDAFRAWLAQNAIPIIANATVKGATGAVMGGLPMAGASLLSSATNALVSGYQASIQADITKVIRIMVIITWLPGCSHFMVVGVVSQNTMLG